MADLTITLDGVPISVNLAAGDSIASERAAAAEAAADTAEAALASIIADPDVSALGTTTTINAGDKVVVYRAGTPLQFTGTFPVIGAQGAMFVGDTSTTRSTDPTARFGRNITSTPLGSPHGVAFENVYNWATDDLSAAEVDVRPTKSGAMDMEHIGLVQANLLISGAGTVQDVLNVIVAPDVQDGTVVRSTGLHYAPSVGGTGEILQNRVIDAGTLAEYTDPGSPTTGNTNYVLYCTGKARGSMGGQMHSGTGFRAADNDGVCPEKFTAEIDGTSNAYVFWTQSGNWNWRLGMTKDDTDLLLKGNNTEAWRFKAVTNHIEPSVADAQDIGGSSKNVRYVYANEIRVGSTKVVGAQGAAVADATDAGSVITQLNALLARLRAHGLIAT